MMRNIVILGLLVTVFGCIGISWLIDRNYCSREECRRYKDFFDRIDPIFKVHSGFTTMPDGEKVDYLMISMDGGLTWWDCDYAMNARGYPAGYTIKGPARKDVLERAERMDRLFEYAASRGGMDPDSPADRDAMRRAGVDVK